MCLVRWPFFRTLLSGSCSVVCRCGALGVGTPMACGTAAVHMELGRTCGACWLGILGALCWGGAYVSCPLSGVCSGLAPGIQALHQPWSYMHMPVQAACGRVAARWHGRWHGMVVLPAMRACISYTTCSSGVIARVTWLVVCVVCTQTRTEPLGGAGGQSVGTISGRAALSTSIDTMKVKGSEGELQFAGACCSVAWYVFVMVMWAEG